MTQRPASPLLQRRAAQLVFCARKNPAGSHFRSIVDSDPWSIRKEKGRTLPCEDVGEAG